MSDNPYLKRAEQTAVGKHGIKSEKRVSKAMGTRLQPASGAMRGAKSDAKGVMAGQVFRVESKSTTNKTMSLDVEWLAKISAEAASDGSIPALTISFVTPAGTPQMSRNADWVAVPLWAWREMMERVS